MNSTSLGRTWDEASSPEAVRLTRRFEMAWRAAVGARPEPLDFLPAAPGDRPGALLALLRAEMALRHEAGQAVDAASYRERYPSLDDDALVALVYEEYCLREESGEAPDPSLYEARFPGVADRLRDILEIHGLVAECPSTAPDPSAEIDADEFPAAGETIAGFRPVDELGRGAFARVFRAEERLLADRPVVLKVARTGNAEPQTLARLQHTHIVPVHSYRTDPARGFHLLCMPYFGRLTLAMALSDAAVAAARSGAELASAIDRLQHAGDRPRAAGRAALAARSYPRAIAWWGARLAEALQHAHERGVLHLDVKPSNILITDDGLPMLLDFNLARDPWSGRRGASADRFGGTLAYMAPEHLEALLERRVGALDHRADLYSLGLVLLEAVGSPPSVGAADAPRRLLEARRAGPPGTRETHRPIPPAFRAVLRRCLEPVPSHRYATAAELAADLQAVADDAPLPFAREPMASRAAGSIRRNRRRLAIAAPIVLALILAAAARFQVQADRVRREFEVRRLYDLGRSWLAAGDGATAAAEFATAAEQAEGRPGLRALGADARAMSGLARAIDDFARQSDRLRFHLLGFGGDADGDARDLDAALARFGVAEFPDWSRRGDLVRLDERTRARLVEQVNDLLFLGLVAAGRSHPDDPSTIRRAVSACDRALASAGPRGPWEALRSWWLDRQWVPRRDLARETSARACFQWGLLAMLGRDGPRARAWLDRARFLRPDDYWHQYALAFHLAEHGDIDGALRHYEAAIALRPGAPWAWYNRADLYAFRRGVWTLALRDLDRAVAAADGMPADRARFRIARGQVLQAVGDVIGARADFDAAIAANPVGRAARLDRARLDAEAGFARRARSAYDALVADDPTDRTARLARARLSLRQGRSDDAEADFSRLLTDADGAPASQRAEWFSGLAMARITQGRGREALADAATARRLDPTPARDRLLARASLAAGGPIDERLLAPDAIAAWPVGGPLLRSDLTAAIDRLGGSASDPDRTVAAAALRARAAMLSALGEDPRASAEADRAVDRSPTALSYAVRAEVRLRSGDRPGASADAGRGLSLSPDDPRLLILRGRLATMAGDPESGLRRLDRAVFAGGGAPAQAWRARAQAALGRDRAAVQAWSSALAEDPDDPESFLGRAESMRRLGHWENALADPESAAERAADGSPLLARVTLAELACLTARPDRLPRLLQLARRALIASPPPTALRCRADVAP